jgi:glycosyltransferase involved in cell wall biosynthesis
MMSQPESPLLSFVIPTYKRPQSLDRLLVSILVQKDGFESFEVVVVNNCMEENSKIEEICRDFVDKGLPVRLFHQPLPGGSQARNMGIENAKGQWLAFIDDDEDLLTGYLQGAISILNTAQDNWLFGGPCFAVYDGEKPVWVKDQYYSIDYGSKPKDLNKEHLPGGNLLISRAFLDQLGGFSTQMGHVGSKSGYGEDTDFIMRAEKAGGFQKYEPGIAVHHHIPEDKLSLQWLLRQKQLSSISKAHLYFKFHPPSTNKAKKAAECFYYLRQAIGTFLSYLAVRLKEPFKNKQSFPYHENYWVEVVLPCYAKYRINLELCRSIFFCIDLAN